MPRRHPAAPPPERSARERTNQKLRTRNALVAAAREFISVGKLPSVGEVAEAALVSPATAYRYFPDRLVLLKEAARELPPGAQAAFHPDVDHSLEPAERTAVASGKILRNVLGREQLVRALMMLSMQQTVEGPDKEAPLRPFFRVAWFDESLRSEEKRISPAVLKRLKLALIALVSPESVFTLKDQFGLGNDEAIAVCTWGARMLVEGASAPKVRGARRK